MKIELDKGAIQPTRAYPFDAGLDLYSKDDKCVVPAHGSYIFDTGVHVAIPNGYAGFVKSKSGLNIKHDLTADGVIDYGYTGSIVVKLYNHGNKDYVVNYGDKIAQLVIVEINLPKLVLTKLNKDTQRGNNGFGSTGK
jgi:dUTP pyrophosphatase